MMSDKIRVPWLLAGILALVSAPVAAQPSTTRVSVGPDGVQGNQPSFEPAISGDGRWVAFESFASNLTPDDTVGTRDIFLYDRLTRFTTRVSEGPAGAQANGQSRRPRITANGRWIVYTSEASNLVPGDTNSQQDVFVYDRFTETTTRASVGTGGVQANAGSGSPHITDDGRLVFFGSSASNLVPDDLSFQSDIYVHDRQTGTTTLVSVGPGIDPLNEGGVAPASVSADGRWVAIVSLGLTPSDRHRFFDVFLHDRQTRTTSRISLAPDGTRSNGNSVNPVLSADGRSLVFDSGAANLVPGDDRFEDDVFLYNVSVGTMTRVSVGPGGVEGNGSSSNPDISADGRWVTFHSYARNLVAGDTNGQSDVFLLDRQTATMTRVSIGSTGSQANSTNWYPSVSDDGRVVVFQSFASNLVPGDTNGMADIFVHDRGDPACTLSLNPPSVSAAAAGAIGTVTVEATTACVWTAASNDPGWLTIANGASATGPGAVTYSIAANVGAARIGSLVIGGQVFTVSQASGLLHGAPRNLNASASGNVVVLAWLAPLGGLPPTSYVLEAGRTSGSADVATVITGNTSTSFTASSVPDGVFFVRVRGRNSSGTGPPSNEVRVVVGPEPCTSAPGPPSNLVSVVVESQVTLTWSAGTGAVASHRIEVGASPGASDVTVVTTGTTQTLLTATAPNGTYFVRVRAGNACGLSTPSNEARVVVGPQTCTAPPGAPTGLTAGVAGPRVTLAWGAASGDPSAYLLEAGSSPGAADIATVDLSGQRTTFEAMAPNGVYFIRVRARNSCGVSPASNEVSVPVQ